MNLYNVIDRHCEGLKIIVKANKAIVEAHQIIVKPQK